MKNGKNYIQNWISLAGIVFSLVFFLAVCFLIVLDLTRQNANPYLQTVTYLIVPAFLVVSLAAIPLGVILERKRRKRGQDKALKLPAIDFNDPVHQKWVLTTVGALTLFGLFSVFGAYRVYEFTDSVAFCGLMCHKVMEPEYTAYQHSPHARVACVQCHVGPGAEWFVRAKLSGLYQIYSSIFNRFSRPIETPVKNLRPAQETCGQCHWPQQFFGAVEQEHHYFLSDEANSPWESRMLMFVGGGPPKKKGIHWHMNIDNKIEYVASDAKRQVIPWVRSTSSDGKSEVYADEGSGASSDRPPPGELRRMDCVDCHNRPSHVYKAPMRLVNEAMAAGTVASDLPYIKREAVRVLSEPYESKGEAETAIRTQLEKFYRENYPEVWNGKRPALERAIASLIRMYGDNFFPFMKASWKAYPDNIGHMIFPGCFRCHDGKHRTAGGKTITRDCSACHAILVQGPAGALEKNVDGLEFRHPGDDEGMWKEMSCSECHTGGAQ